MLRLKRYAITLLTFWHIACGDNPYDFTPEPDSETVVEDPCDAIPVRGLPCDYGTTTDCYATFEMTTSEVGTALGCATAGSFMGVVEWDPFLGPERRDLLAWVHADGGSNAAEGRTFLSVSTDRCGNELLGGDDWCGYQPFVMRPDIDISEPIFLQTVAADSGSAWVGFQLVARTAWESPLPPPADGIACEVPPLRVGTGVLKAAGTAVLPPEPHVVDIKLIPPPALYNQQPWLCDHTVSPTREWGYQLHATGETPFIDYLTVLNENSQSLPFHYALYQCNQDGRVEVTDVPLSMGCGVKYGLIQKQLEIFEAPDASGLHLDTQYVLLLGVSPTVTTVGEDIKLVIEPGSI